MLAVLAVLASLRAAARVSARALDRTPPSSPGGTLRKLALSSVASIGGSVFPNITTLEAEFSVYRLGVVGADDFWLWCVSLDDDDLAEGTARTPGDAMAAAEVAASQLAQPCFCRAC